MSDSTNRGGWVYFIQHGGGGPVKIGVTGSDPRSRMRTLQTGAPEQLQILGVLRGDRDLERALHERFAHLRIRPDGEWFRHEAELAAFIAGASAAANDKPDYAEAFERIFVALGLSARAMLLAARQVPEHGPELQEAISSALHATGKAVGELQKIDAVQPAATLEAIVSLGLEIDPEA